MDGRHGSSTGNSKKLGRWLGVLAAVVAGSAFLYVIVWDFLSSQFIFTAYRGDAPILLVVSAVATATGRRRMRSVWVAYFCTGAGLAIFRVSVLAWVFYHWRGGQSTETLANLGSFFSPEAMSGGLIMWGETFQSETLRPFFLFWASVLTVGSFIMATPILLVVWLRQRRR